MELIEVNYRAPFRGTECDKLAEHWFSVDGKAAIKELEDILDDAKGWATQEQIIKMLAVHSSLKQIEQHYYNHIGDG